MNQLADILNSLKDNSFALVFLFALGVLIVVGIKKNWFSYKSEKLRIGLSEQSTRDLIQSQFDYANAKCEGMISQLPKDLNVYHSKYVIARVEDVIQKSIIFNNMSRNKSYIKSKQELVYQTIMKRVDNEWFMTEDFKKLVYSFVEDLYNELVDMKESKTN